MQAVHKNLLEMYIKISCCELLTLTDNKSCLDEYTTLLSRVLTVYSAHISELTVSPATPCYTDFMNFRFFWKKMGSDATDRGSDKSAAIIRSADSALAQYSKTFKDLARYDRGERVFNQVSR